MANVVGRTSWMLPSSFSYSPGVVNIFKIPATNAFKNQHSAACSKAVGRRRKEPALPRDGDMMTGSFLCPSIKAVQILDPPVRTHNMNNSNWDTPSSWSAPSSDTDLPPIMASDNPHEDDDGRLLSKGMSKYFATGEFSDMKIKCGATVHAVHRIVVCSQSPFFTNAMNQEHGFKEAQTNTVELNDDHPVTVKAMLDYMYLEKYSDLGFGDKLEERISLHIDVYAIADRLSVGGLRKHAAGNLKTLMFKEPASPELLAGIIGNAYEKTPENDRYLRPLMVKTVSDRIEKLIQNEDFMTLMESVQGFNPALVEMLVLDKPYRPCKRYFCHSCNEAYYSVLPETVVVQPWGATKQADGMYCPGCGTYQSNDKWRQNPPGW